MGLKRKFFTVSLLSVYVCHCEAQPLPEYVHFVDAPDSVFIDGNGHHKKISDFKGRVLLVNFWATWCAPCVIEMPAFDALKKRYQKAGFDVIAINVGHESDARIRQFMKSHDLAHLSVYKGKEDILSAFGVSVLPTTFLVDRSGKIVAGKNGLAKWHSAGIYRQIESFLREGVQQKAPYLLDGIGKIDTLDLR